MKIYKMGRLSSLFLLFFWLLIPWQLCGQETSEQENQAERQAKIQAAVAEMLTADPEATPKCPDIAAKTGLLNIRKEERDAAVAAFKQAAAGNETEESQGE